MNHGDTTNRPPYWDEEPPAENRTRRGQQPSTRVGRRAAAAEDAEDAESLDWEERVSSRNAARVDRPGGVAGARARWWRPESMWGRALLALAAFAVIGGSLVSALLLHNALESDDRFRIAGASSIECTGLDEVSRADVLPIFGEDIGKNIFFIHLDERRRAIEALPWVKHATVMRLLPNRLRVAVEERKPVAFTQINGETGLVDGDGVLLTMSAAAMAERHYSFPEVTGLYPTSKPDDRRMRMNVFLQMMQELDAGGQHNSLQISEVDLSDPEDARVKMVEQGGDVVAHLGYERFLDRYQRYMRHIAEWRQQYPRLMGVDLRYKGQVVLKMAPAAPGEAHPQPASAQQNPPAGQPPAQAQSHQSEAGKSTAHAGAATKNAAAHGANSHAGKAKTAKQKADPARADRARAEKQRRKPAERNPQWSTARHRAPAVQPNPPAMEGQ